MLVGFALVPWIVRTQIVPAVAADIGYPLDIDEVDFNPFVISLEARGFRMTEADGAPLLRFDRLFVNLQLSSLVRRAWWFHEVELDGFVADLRRDRRRVDERRPVRRRSVVSVRRPPSPIRSSPMPNCRG